MTGGIVRSVIDTRVSGEAVTTLRLIGENLKHPSASDIGKNGARCNQWYGEYLKLPPLQSKWRRTLQMQVEFNSAKLLQTQSVIGFLNSSVNQWMPLHQYSLSLPALNADTASAIAGDRERSFSVLAQNVVTSGKQWGKQFARSMERNVGGPSQN